MCDNKYNSTYYVEWCLTINCFVPSVVKLSCRDAVTHNVMTKTKTMMDELFGQMRHISLHHPTQKISSLLDYIYMYHLHWISFQPLEVLVTFIIDPCIRLHYKKLKYNYRYFNFFFK